MFLVIVFPPNKNETGYPDPEVVPRPTLLDGLK